MNEKKSWLIIILVFVMLVVATFVVIFILFKDSWFESQSNNPNNNNEDNTVYCTADAKMCPDGSYVGRVAPDCEFEACPEVISSSTNEGFLPEVNNSFDAVIWEEVNKNNLIYQVPKEIGGFNFVKLNDFPTEVKLLDEKFSCEEEGDTKKIINSTTYCVNVFSEGAAGSIFDTYNYTTSFSDNKVLEIVFTVIFPQCMNYDGLRAEDCIQEEKDFNIDYLIGRVAKSVNEVSN
ncbi:MAG: hypothetical protein WC070_03505 [Candidatus Magasanikbacteria bacterium]